MYLQHRSRISSNQSRRFTEKRHRRFVIGGGLAAIALASWLFAFYRLNSLNALNIQTIDITGADTDITTTLEAAVGDAISGNYFGLFPKSSILLYPKSAVRRAVAEASPRIENVSVKREGLSALAIMVTEKVPVALICAGLPDFLGESLILRDDSPCYYADSTGLVYAPASTSPVAEDRFFVPSFSGKAGTRPISESEFSALRDFYDGVKPSGMEPSAILVKGNGEYEMYASGTVIYFDDKSSLADELSNLASFWLSKSQQARTAGTPMKFDYLDVRYGDKVYYR